MSIKTSFSIKELENLSGIKAHTIRIWEKRYGLLKPERSDANIRTYDLQNLKKILNVALLNQHGVKISKVARMDESEINMRLQELAINGENNSSQAINAFKLAMLNFDELLFDKTFNQLLAQHSFRDIFLHTFLQLLDEIGTLWTTNTITPAHEHFISTLIKQKLLVNIERIQHSTNTHGKTYILFLPSNEIHELGLLYIHFELLLKGYRSVYLGPSVPMDNLLEVQGVFDCTSFVSYFTVEPVVQQVEDYLKDFNTKILDTRKEDFHIIGRNTTGLKDSELPAKVHLHSDIMALVNSL